MSSIAEFRPREGIHREGLTSHKGLVAEKCLRTKSHGDKTSWCRVVVRVAFDPLTFYPHDILYADILPESSKLLEFYIELHSLPK